VWTYGADRPLGMITASEKAGDARDAAIIRLDPSIGVPTGDVGDRYPVRDVLSPFQIHDGMPFCKLGAVTGETCGTIKGKNGDVIEASVYSRDGDSGSPAFVKNADGTVSAGRHLDVFARRRRLHDVFHPRVSGASQLGLARPALKCADPR
jgi:hypothetical protein